MISSGSVLKGVLGFFFFGPVLFCFDKWLELYAWFRRQALLATRRGSRGTLGFNSSRFILLSMKQHSDIASAWRPGLLESSPVRAGLAPCQPRQCWTPASKAGPVVKELLLRAVE